MPLCNQCDRVAATAEMRRVRNDGGWVCKDSVPCNRRVAATLDYDTFEIKTRKVRGKPFMEIQYREPGRKRWTKFLYEIDEYDTRQEIEARVVTLVRNHATGS